MYSLNKHEGLLFEKIYIFQKSTTFQIFLMAYLLFWKGYAFASYIKHQIDKYRSIFNLNKKWAKGKSCLFERKSYAFDEFWNTKFLPLMKKFFKCGV